MYDDYVDQRDLTEEEKQRIEEDKERWHEASRQEARERRNKKDREMKEAAKKAMNKPIDALPVREMCEYAALKFILEGHDLLQIYL